jgi:hypothetical protein
MEESSILRSKKADFRRPDFLPVPEIRIYARSVFPGDKDLDFQEPGFADLLDWPQVEMIDFSQFSNRQGSRILVLLPGGFYCHGLVLHLFNWDGSHAFSTRAEAGLFPNEWIFTLPIDLPQAWSRMQILAIQD